MNKDLASKVLNEFIKCLDDKGFIVYGTALGAHRENNFISHDLDIDIGIMKEDFNFEMLENIIKKGFKILSVFGNFQYGYEISFKKSGIKIDLMFFYYYHNRRIIWNSLWDNGGRNGLSDMIIHSYNEDDFQLEEVLIGKNKFLSLGINYIKKVYGENWKIPVKKWDWKKDHLCRDDNLKIDILKKYGK